MTGQRSPLFSEMTCTGLSTESPTDPGNLDSGPPITCRISALYLLRASTFISESGLAEMGWQKALLYRTQNFTPKRMKQSTFYTFS